MFSFFFIIQAEAGFAPTTEFLKVAEQFTNETNYTVWNDLTANFNKLDIVMQNTGFYSSFQAFRVKLYEKIVDKLRWEPKEGEGRSSLPVLSDI